MIPFDEIWVMLVVGCISVEAALGTMEEKVLEMNVTDEVLLSPSTTVWAVAPSEIVVTTSSLRKRLWEATNTEPKISGTLIVSYNWLTVGFFFGVVYYGQWLFFVVMELNRTNGVHMALSSWSQHA